MTTQTTESTKSKRGPKSHCPDTDILLAYAARPDASYRQLATIYGVSEPCARLWIRNAGVKLPRYHKYSEADIQALAPDHSINEIKDKLGISYQSVLLCLKRLKITPFKRTHKRSLHNSRKMTDRIGNRYIEVLGDLKKNPTDNFSVIGQRNHCSREYVSQIHAAAVHHGVLP